MADRENQIVLDLNGGVTEGIVQETSNGVIVQSQNTRLTSTRGTVSRRPGDAQIKSLYGAPACGGFVRGVRDTAIAYFKPEIGQYRFLEGSIEKVPSPITGTDGQNAYYPYPLVEAGAISGTLLRCPPSTCFDGLGRQWFAAGRATTVVASAIYLGVQGAPDADYPEGKDLCAPRVVVVQAANLSEWVALTPNGSGVTLWYESATGIQCQTYNVVVSAGNSVVTAVGAPVVVYNSLRNNEAAVCSDGQGFAYLMCRHSATATTAVLLKVAQSTGIVISALPLPLTLTAAAQEAHFAVSYWQTFGAVENVGFCVSDFSGNFTKGVAAATTMLALWNTTGLTGYGRCSVQPYLTLGKDRVIFAHTNESALGPGAGVTFTRMSERVRTTGAFNSDIQVSWYILQAHGAYHAVQPGIEVYPYFPLLPRWASGVHVPGGALYQDLPQIVVVTPFSYNGGTPVACYTPVARCGVDRVSAADGQRPKVGTTSAMSPAGRLALTYIEDRFDLPTSAVEGYTARYVHFDMAFNGQCGTASEAAHVGIVAGALPVTWDGRNTVEYAPFTRPFLTVNPVGGSGPNLNGTYSYTAVVTYRGLSGMVRRSAPAKVVTVVFGGSNPIITVTAPLTLSNGVTQGAFDITIYATLPGGSVFYAINATNVVKSTQEWQFQFIFNTVANSLQLYSLGGPGEELLPECPPPAHDMRSIGGRIWAIDAEDRYRLLPSKRKQAMLLSEFNGNLEVVNFGHQYGRLVAVVDVGGVPFVLAEQGIWRVDGYGPDNAGGGSFFGDPQLVSNQGCRRRETVAQIPSVGVMFQNADGLFCLLTPAGVRGFTNFGTYDVSAPMVNLRESELIYPIDGGSGYVVYNWEADGWTHWDDNGRDVSAAISLPAYAHTNSYFYARDVDYGYIMKMESNAADTNNEHSIIVDRGWIAPESPQGDCFIREVYLHAIQSAFHSLRIRVYFDYDTSNYVEQTWTSAELLPLLQDQRYTVSVMCDHTPARACKVTVEATPEAAGEFFQPLTLTIAYGVNSGFRRRTLLEGASK